MNGQHASIRWRGKGAFSIYIREGAGQEVFAEDVNFFDPPSVLTSNVDRPHLPPPFRRVKLFMPPLLVDRPPPPWLNF